MTPAQEKQHDIATFQARLRDVRGSKNISAMFRDICCNHPEQVAERVLWLLRGHYGRRSYLLFWRVMKNADPRDRAEWCVSVVGAVEWGSLPLVNLAEPDREKLYTLVNATIEREIADKAEANDETE